MLALVLVELSSGESLSRPSLAGEQWTPLHRCARKGHTDACRFLLQNGADVTLRTMEQWTPLHCACVGGHPAVSFEFGTASLEIIVRGKERQGCKQGRLRVSHVIARQL